ncbi:hypothetical protein BH10CHL1_BH10CHL1_12590 [soil metagenome]
MPGIFSLHQRSLRISTLRLVIAILVGAMALVLSPAAYAKDNVHVVAGGESLASIASLYGVTVQTLISTNDLSNPNFIYSGQRLMIPGSETTTTANEASPADGYYTVGRGDTLSQIASDHGMTQADLMRLNGLGNENFVWVGQQLRVSARVAAVSVDNTATPAIAETIYVVKVGDTLSSIAQANNTTPEALLVANGLPNANFVWVGQRLRVGGSDTANGSLVDDSATVSDTVIAPTDGVRWIEVNLTTQTLIAWQGDVAVMDTKISSGRSATPTVTGRFKIYTKYTSQRMIGPGYDLPNVPWVMYFFSNYGIHGAYWHNNFGNPMSHGCVNMRPGEAAILYNWASIGTEVYVHF